MAIALRPAHNAGAGGGGGGGAHGAQSSETPGDK